MTWDRFRFSKAGKLLWPLMALFGILLFCAVTALGTLCILANDAMFGIAGLFKRKPPAPHTHTRHRIRPYHYIRPGNRAWMPKFIAVAVLGLTLAASAASVSWRVSGVTDSGALVTGGQAWCLRGSDTATTIAQIQAGTFDTRGGVPINCGVASGRVSAPAHSDVYAYLVIVYNGKYNVSAVSHVAPGGSFTFQAPTQWVQVPEPSAVMLLGLGVTLMALKRRQQGTN